MGRYSVRWRARRQRVICFGRVAGHCDSCNNAVSARVCLCVCLCVDTLTHSLTEGGRKKITTTETVERTQHSQRETKRKGGKEGRRDESTEHSVAQSLTHSTLEQPNNQTNDFFTLRNLRRRVSTDIGVHACMYRHVTWARAREGPGILCFVFSVFYYVIVCFDSPFLTLSLFCLLTSTLPRRHNLSSS